MSEDTFQKAVYAHFCTWFRTPDVSGQWQMWESSFEQAPHDPDTVHANGERDIASPDYPLTGPYDSSDPDAVEYQLLLMRLAGFDGVVVDWDGRRLNPYRHQALMDLLPHLDTFGMKLIVCMEEWCGYWPPGTYADREAEKAAAQDEARWLMTELADRSCYATLRGRKPVLVFRKQPKHWFNADEWDEVRRPIHERGGALMFPADAEDAFNPIIDGRFFWVGGFEPEHRFGSLEGVRDRYQRFLDHAPQRAAHTRPPFVFGSVTSGFDDSHVWGWGNLPRSAPRYDGRRFRMMWQMALEHDVDAVQVITWNDWNEGSHIEPSNRFGYQYLEMNKRYAAQFKQQPDGVPDEALRVPLMIYQARKAGGSDQSGTRHTPDAARLDAAREALLEGRYDEAQSLVMTEARKAGVA